MLSFDITPRITAIPTTANSILPRVTSMLPLAISGTKLITAKEADITPNSNDKDSAADKAFSTGNLPTSVIIPPNIATAPDIARIGAILISFVSLVEAVISANIAITDDNAIVADFNLSVLINDRAPNATDIAPIAAVNAKIVDLLSLANDDDATSTAKQAEIPVTAFKARLT